MAGLAFCPGWLFYHPPSPSPCLTCAVSSFPLRTVVFFYCFLFPLFFFYFFLPSSIFPYPLLNFVSVPGFKASPPWILNSYVCDCRTSRTTHTAPYFPPCSFLVSGPAISLFHHNFLLYPGFSLSSPSFFPKSLQKPELFLFLVHALSPSLRLGRQPIFFTKYSCDSSFLSTFPPHQDVVISIYFPRFLFSILNFQVGRCRSSHSPGIQPPSIVRPLFAPLFPLNEEPSCAPDSFFL